jgi:hypothetical protein
VLGEERRAQGEEQDYKEHGGMVAWMHGNNVEFGIWNLEFGIWNFKFGWLLKKREPRVSGTPWRICRGVS